MHEPIIPASTNGAEGAPAARRYRAFISYSHADTKWARWLIRRLENYRVPVRFHGRAAPIGAVGARIAPVFRDRDELPTTSNLSATILAALRDSATLVVICSPASARSRWVEEEILAFKRLHGESGVFAFIVSGEPKQAGVADDCFSPALRVELGADGQPGSTPAEVVAADLRPHADGKTDAFIRLVAGLLGVGFDDLRRRELQRRYRRMTLVATGSVLGMTLTLGLATLAWQARNDARRRQDQAEDLLSFMVGDLRMPLAKLNKLDLLDAVGEKAMTYFASLNPRDMSDTALRRQAEALRHIGENRKDQARYADAMKSLLAAYGSANALAARHPKNGDLLYERAQTEYWIGWVLRRLGRTDEMTGWFTRYRDSGAALVALDPNEPRWQQEYAYGHHNLAVIDVDAERLDSARRGFLGELAMLTRLSAARPADLQLQFQIGDANSWLGSIAEMSGDLGDGAARYAEQVSRLESILRADPGDAKWKGRLADALALHAGILTITGQRTAAMERRLRAKSLLEALAAGDPKNQTWQRSLLWLRLKEAELIRAEGDLPAAAKLAGEVRETIEKMSAAEPQDRGLQNRLAVVCRLQAELLAALGREGAGEAAAQAVEISEALVKARPVFINVGECAQARVTAGRIAAGRGDTNAARQHWRRALELLQPGLPGSNHWRLLFPAAHAHHRLGQLEASRALVERLQRLGFQPLEAWPDATGAPPSSQNIKPPTR